jgi:UDP-N-acetyl-D-glucosamine dehydrogenase
MRHHDLQLESCDLSDEALADVSCALVLTDHDGVDYERIVSRVPVVVDTRNALKSLKARGNVVPA